MVKALEEDYRTAPISDQDRVMLDYVVQVTKDATRISPADHERLRAVGFDDKGILQITLIASWFNYINRVADALAWAEILQPDEVSTTSRLPAGLARCS
jgi:alkylhydroperoxidase family enzyme